jgi:hypothetical protein
MLPMRIFALGANVCFIGYGEMGWFMPVLALLPINLFRLNTLFGQSGSAMTRPGQNPSDEVTTAGCSYGLL